MSGRSSLLTQRVSVARRQGYWAEIPAEVDRDLTGISFAPGASNVESAWQSLIAAATAEINFLALLVRSTARSGAGTAALLDVAIGGSQEEIAVSDLACGNAFGVGIGKVLSLPIRIHRGEVVSIRIQSNDATPTTSTVRWWAGFAQGFRAPRKLTTLGLANAASSRGTLLTASSTYVEVGRLSQDCQAVLLTFSGANDTGMAGTQSQITLAASETAPVSSQERVLGVFDKLDSSAEDEVLLVPETLIYGHLNAGTRLWAKDTNATNDNVDVVVHEVPYA